MRLSPLLGLVILSSSWACTTPAPFGPRTSVAPDATLLRVMTYNIKSGTRGLDDVAKVIRDTAPDIVALQEVDCRSRRAGKLDQAAVLSEQTEMPYYAHFRTRDVFGGAYGLALLSRFPVEAIEQYPLPMPKGLEPRTVVHALLNVAGREVSVYITHLVHPPFRNHIRVRQGEFIAGLMERDPRPKLLMGDFNDGPGSDTVRLLRHQMTDVFDATGKGWDGTFQLPLPFLPSIRLDYVLASDAFIPLRSSVLRVEASDHYPVVAEVRLKEAPALGADATPQ